MRLGLQVGYWMMGPEDPTESVLLAEKLGYDSVWTAEAYGSDCVSVLSWIGARTTKIKLGTAIMQISARTPACVAMTAMTLDHLSGGRLILGIGVSGPQVVEGWYGQPFPKPMARTREWVELFRQMLKREGPVTYDGEHYQLPYPGGTGLGKPLKLINEPLREHIPLYIGAEGPKNVKQTTEIADGWLQIFYSPYREEMYADALANLRDDFDIACTVNVSMNDDMDQAFFPLKWMMAFYVGGMGAQKQNFHANLMGRMGYPDEAAKIQQLFAEGKRDEAAMMVPEAMLDEICLVGPKERIRERLDAWKRSPVKTMLVTAREPEVLEFMASELL